jgi:hypothetical protein
LGIEQDGAFGWKLCGERGTVVEANAKNAEPIHETVAGDGAERGHLLYSRAEAIRCKIGIEVMGNPVGGRAGIAAPRLSHNFEER